MENEELPDTIDSIELKTLLGVSGQQLKFYKWLPEQIGNGKRKLIIWDRKDVMEAIERQYAKSEAPEEPEQRVYAIESSRFYDAMKDLVAAFNKGMLDKNAYQQYAKYKIVQNRGDIVLACQLKQNVLRPWIYERRREVLIDKCAIK